MEKWRSLADEEKKLEKIPVIYKSIDRQRGSWSVNRAALLFWLWENSLQDVIYCEIFGKICHFFWNTCIKFFLPNGQETSTGSLVPLKSVLSTVSKSAVPWASPSRSPDVLRSCSVIDSFIPLTPRRDQHLISSYNITPKSCSKVMRIKKIISSKRTC